MGVPNRSCTRHVGILFAGLMLTAKGPMLLEYNVHFFLAKHLHELGSEELLLQILGCGCYGTGPTVEEKFPYRKFSGTKRDANFGLEERF